MKYTISIKAFHNCGYMTIHNINNVARTNIPDVIKQYEKGTKKLDITIKTVVKNKSKKIVNPVYSK